MDTSHDIGYGSLYTVTMGSHTATFKLTFRPVPAILRSGGSLRRRPLRPRRQEERSCSISLDPMPCWSDPRAPSRSRLGTRSRGGSPCSSRAAVADSEHSEPPGSMASPKGATINSSRSMPSREPRAFKASGAGPSRITAGPRRWSARSSATGSSTPRHRPTSSLRGSASASSRSAPAASNG